MAEEKDCEEYLMIGCPVETERESQALKEQIIFLSFFNFKYIYIFYLKKKSIYLFSCAESQLWVLGIFDFHCGMELFIVAWSSVGKESACNAGDLALITGSGKIPWRRKWQPTPVFLTGEFYGQRSLVGYSLWSCKESGLMSN